MGKTFFLGIDVGTGSARAGIFDENGNMAGQASHPIRMWRPQSDFVQQSSDDIWKACAVSVKEAVKKAGISPDAIKGIGFDATCSLVVLGDGAEPVTVSPDGSEEQNIIVWMDHRAKKEAEKINQSGHKVLDYVGGVISPEMQTPKLLWIKRHMPETWNRATAFFDLPDYLVYRATGDDVRSACTTTCKWTYLCHEESETEGRAGRWDETYFRRIGLEELPGENYERIGKRVRPVGEAAGSGLSEKAAGDLGLKPGTPVGVSIIDAHAGGLGLLGMNPDGSNTARFDEKIALIGGTSSCHMAVSPEPRFIDGVWGPYFSAMLPGMWLNEGGQSATGALIDHMIFSSQHAERLKKQAEQENSSIYDLLNARLNRMANQRNLDDPGKLTNNLHTLPYFHGNRSPRANPSLSGMVSGLKLSSSPDDLALLYLSAVQAVAYGTRHIIETMNENGYSIRQIMATGGGTKNKLFLQEHANITGCTLVLPKEQEAVLLGSAVLGAVASGVYSDVFGAMEAMNQSGRVIEPKRGETERYHRQKYKVFHKMYHDERSYAEIMDKHGG
jgi:FGGY-family pentulose kinase